MTKPIEPGDVLWADLDGNHKIDQLDRVKVGNIYPKWTGGFSTTLSYKNVSLYGRFDFALGHTILNMVAMRSLGQSVGFKNIIKEGLKTWTEENTNTDLPKSYYDDSTNKRISTVIPRAVILLLLMIEVPDSMKRGLSGFKRINFELEITC